MEFQFLIQFALKEKYIETNSINQTLEVMNSAKKIGKVLIDSLHTILKPLAIFFNLDYSIDINFCFLTLKCKFMAIQIEMCIVGV